MFEVDGSTIKITRGNKGAIGVVAEKEDEQIYEFQTGQKIRFAIYNKGKMENLVFEKIVDINEPSNEIPIKLTTEDTKIGNLINKPTNYWYEIELILEDGEVETICGYDDDGPKILRLYPEGDDSK